MDAGHSFARQLADDLVHDPATPPLALEPGKEVDVKVGRVLRQQGGIRSRGLMDPRDEGPVGLGGAAAQRQALTQRRQPDGDEPVLERRGVGDGEAVAGDALVVVDDPGDGLGEGEVGPGPEVSEEVGVGVAGGGVATGVAGEAADAVDPGEVVQGAFAHRRHGIHGSEVCRSRHDVEAARLASRHRP